LTNFSGDQHAWPLYLTIGNIRKFIARKTKMCAWILVRVIPCPVKRAKNIDEASHSAVATVLSQLKHLDLTGPSFKWDCPDGYEQQCYPRLADCVGDYPVHVMDAQVSYVSCPMCEFPKGVLMGHSTCRPLDNSRDQHIYQELLEDDHIDVLHTLDVIRIRNKFWQYPLCNVVMAVMIRFLPNGTRCFQGRVTANLI
jgi:hypothetical protein